MPEISTTINQKTADWIDKISSKKGFKSRGEALDYLINQQLKRRGDKWLKTRTVKESEPAAQTPKKSRSSSKKTTTPKLTARPTENAGTLTTEKPSE